MTEENKPTEKPPKAPPPPPQNYDDGPVDLSESPSETQDSGPSETKGDD